MRRIAFTNEKGGTGKTTLCVNVGSYLALHRKKRVLIVDLDTQGHAGKSLGVDARTIRPNVFDLLTRPEVSVAQVAHPTSVEGLDVVPSNKAMTDFPVLMWHDVRRTRRLDDKVRDLPYDFVLYDAPPSMGLTTINIMAASDEVVVPVALTYLALDGCAEIVDTLKQVALEHGRPSLGVSLVVPTMYRKTALADEILEKLRSYFPQRVARFPVGYSVRIDEAQSHGKTIWEYAPSSPGAAMFKSVAEEILRFGEKAAKAPAAEKPVAVPAATSAAPAP